MLCGTVQAAAVYPEVRVEEYPAEGGTLVSCHGAVTQQEAGRAPALLQPFCQAWDAFILSKGKLRLLLLSVMRCEETCTTVEAPKGEFGV